jgi:hypothetical protein
MKLNIIIWVFLLITSSIFADLNSATVKKNDAINNVIAQTAKDEQILFLQNKVKELETELKKYTQVKPGSTKSLLPENRFQRKTKQSSDEKYKITLTAPEQMPAYFTSKYQTVYELKSKLKKNGFEILAIDEIYKGYFVITVTNDELKNTNSFISALHISVEIGKDIRFQNPNYFAAAYLQDDYKYGSFNKTMNSFLLVLGDIYSMSAKIPLDDLASYHFMLGMPRFDDTIALYHNEDILSKFDSNESVNYVSYKLELPNGSVLVGHKLKLSTYEYFEKINVKEYAAMFPYEVMITDNRAYMMHPRYYLALSLPLLSMTDFMKIASAPVEIIKDIKKFYK